MDYGKLAAEHDKANRMMKIKFSSVFNDMEITSMQAMALSYIMEKTEQGIDVFQKDLTCFLFIRESSVASIVNNLERLGLVCRVSSAFDARCKCLVPSHSAWKLKNVINEKLIQYNEETYDGISDEDLLVYERVLAKMTDNSSRTLGRSCD